MKKIDLEKKLTKSFGTILRDNPTVDSIAKTFPTLTIDMLKKFDLPKTFDGRIIWGDALLPNSEMLECGRGWIFALVEVLSGRYNIYTPYQPNIGITSIEPIFCPDERIITKIEPNDSDSSVILKKDCSICSNTVYYALQYLYTHGSGLTACAIYENAIEIEGVKSACDYKSIDDVSKETCKKIFGPDLDVCFDKKRAKRHFRCSTFANVENNEETIKREIFEHGPVVCSYQIYEDFLNEFDPIKQIYTGPKSSSKLLGGHSGKIVGWGERDKIPYWIVSNSWSEYWGMGGYFYMERGKNVCQIENNVVTIFPEIAVNYRIYPEQITIINPTLNNIRNSIIIDPYNYYFPITIQKIKRGEIRGDITPYYDLELIPDLRTLLAGEILKYPVMYKQEKLNITFVAMAIIFAIIAGVGMGYFLLRLFGGKKRKKRGKKRK